MIGLRIDCIEHLNNSAMYSLGVRPLGARGMILS